MTVQFGARWLYPASYVRPLDKTDPDFEDRLSDFVADPAVQRILSTTSDDIHLQIRRKATEHGQPPTQNEITLQIDRLASQIPEDLQDYREPQRIVYMGDDALFDNDERIAKLQQWMNREVARVSDELELFDRMA